MARRVGGRRPGHRSVIDGHVSLAPAPGRGRGAPSRRALVLGLSPTGRNVLPFARVVPNVLRAALRRRARAGALAVVLVLTMIATACTSASSGRRTQADELPPRPVG